MNKQRMLSLSKRGVRVAAMCITLTACVDISATIANESTPTITSSLLPTGMPTLTPTQGPTPTVTPILPTPALPSSVQSDFFLGGNSPDCRLPCWNGLVIGQSDLEDIQQVFDDVFGFNGTYNLSPEPSEVTEGLAFVNYEWETSGGDWEDLRITFWLEEDSYTLQGIRFRWSGYITYGTQITLRNILRELGPPSHSWGLLGGPQAFSVPYDVVAIYEEQGVVFRLLGDLPSEVIIRPDNSVEASAEVCLEERFSSGVIYIMEPLENGLRVSDMSPLQESAIGFVRRDRRYLDPLEEVFGLTAEEITALAIQEEEPCFVITMIGSEWVRSAITATPDVSALSTAMLPDSVENEFFLGGNSPECQLPCWNGLVIGESGQEDIQAVFDDIFGFNGAIDFFAEPEPPSHFPSVYTTEGFDVVGYQWSNSYRINYLRIYFFVEEDTRILQGMLFYGGGESYQFDHPESLRPILRELGPPSQLLVDLSPREGGGHFYEFDIAAIYQEEGVSFILSGILPVDTELWEADYCLGDNFLIEEVYITEPLLNGLRDLSPLQEGLLNAVIDWSLFGPSEDVIGLTAEELTALAMQDEDVCITVEVAH